MSNLSSQRRMMLIIVLKLMNRWTEKWSANIYAVITVGKWHVTAAVSEVWSCVFSPNDAAGCSAVSLILILFLSSCQWLLSGCLKLVPLIHVSFKGGRWLICDSRWGAVKPATAGDDTSWTCLASACLKYLLSIPLHGFLTNERIPSKTH